MKYLIEERSTAPRVIEADTYEEAVEMWRVREGTFTELTTVKVSEVSPCVRFNVNPIITTKYLIRRVD